MNNKTSPTIKVFTKINPPKNNHLKNKKIFNKWTQSSLKLKAKNPLPKKYSKINNQFNNLKNPNKLMKILTK